VQHVSVVEQLVVVVVVVVVLILVGLIVVVVVNATDVIRTGITLSSPCR